MSLGRSRGNVITFAFTGLDALPDEFSLGAQICLDGAEKLATTSIPTPATYILAFHAMELVLKAYLAKEGVSERTLRKKYGHNLVKLYDKACKGTSRFCE